MLARDLLSITIISFVLIAFIFIPFFPGRHDHLAVPLSFMTQIFSYVSLLLVPFGIFWWWRERALKKFPGSINGNKLKKIACTHLYITVVLSAFGAISNGSILLGFMLIVLSTTVFIMVLRRIRSGHSTLKIRNAPLYFIFIPLIIFASRQLFIVPAVAYSRTTAIRNSEPLINLIETYKIREGHYPLSLLSLHADIEPRVIGIEKYHYEPNGEAYNLYFEQFTYKLDILEIVMYNKLDEHAFTVHDLDILEYSGNELAMRRGDRRKFDLPQAHWKYIWFD